MARLVRVSLQDQHSQGELRQLLEGHQVCAKVLCHPAAQGRSAEGARAGQKRAREALPARPHADRRAVLRLQPAAGIQAGVAPRLLVQPGRRGMAI